MAEEPVPVENPVVAEEPVPFKEPVVAEEPVPVEEPAVAGHSAAGELPLAPAAGMCRDEHVPQPDTIALAAVAAAAGSGQVQGPPVPGTGSQMGVPEVTTAPAGPSTAPAADATGAASPAVSSAPQPEGPGPDVVVLPGAGAVPVVDLDGGAGGPVELDRPLPSAATPDGAQQVAAVGADVRPAPVWAENWPAGEIWVEPPASPVAMLGYPPSEPVFDVLASRPWLALDMADLVLATGLSRREVLRDLEALVQQGDVLMRARDGRVCYCAVP